ncbi:hypothetical protein PAXRUDRAFT_165458 [Paxillus rubicundulus Ve08.2h10]|uniref:DDE-1 domain-containing protein n=1 Tax=Paxillus rubicundulus Ve08.2h10 TaxID=930991 RepID=A0A0D0C461_9AGAM|nr:hypothetical protein PAXRUDRAFT_165458 [Paxillus rubicundulus Ve08.2h10]
MVFQTSSSLALKGKFWLTYLFTENADGSQKLLPLIIGKAQKPHAFKNKTGSQLGFYHQTMQRHG